MKPYFIGSVSERLQSPPARGRGLKRAFPEDLPKGALSPPARGRGLKLCDTLLKFCNMLSPPARGRGLKHKPRIYRRQAVRRPPRGGVD